MAFEVTSITTAVGDVNGAVNWTYTNGSGSISGKTSFTAEQMALVNPATTTVTQINTWLATYAGNTAAQLDDAIAARAAAASEAASQVVYENVDGSWVTE